MRDRSDFEITSDKDQFVSGRIRFKQDPPVCLQTTQSMDLGGGGLMSHAWIFVISWRPVSQEGIKKKPKIHKTEWQFIHQWAPNYGVNRLLVGPRVNGNRHVTAVITSAAAFELAWCGYQNYWGLIHTSHMTRDATHNTTQANGTCCHQWEYSHCMQATSKEKCSNLCAHRVARSVWIMPEAERPGWAIYSSAFFEICKFSCCLETCSCWKMRDESSFGRISCVAGYFFWKNENVSDKSFWQHP